MSLPKAKRLADLREEIDLASKGLSALHKDFRKQIDHEILSGFTDYLKGNGFTISKSNLGAQAEYKDLKIKLELANPADQFMGIYHSFDILVNDKKKEVTIVPTFTGTPSRPSVRSGDSVQILEEDLRLAKEEVAHKKLVDFKYNCTQRTNNSRVDPVIKDSVADVLDYFLS